MAVAERGHRIAIPGGRPFDGTGADPVQDAPVIVVGEVMEPRDVPG